MVDLKSNFTYKKDEIFAVDIMDTVAVLNFPAITLKARKATCNFPGYIILMKKN